MNDELRQLIAEVRSLRERVAQLEAANLSLSAADMLAAIKTVDGSGSGLDADTLDGISSASFGQLGQAGTWSADQTFNGKVLLGATTLYLQRYAAGILHLNPGETFSLANDATYQFTAKPFGFVYVLDVSSGHVGAFTFRGGGNAVTEIAESGSNFTVTKDNASTINVYYDTSAYYIQNKRGSSRSLTVYVMGTIA